MLLLLPIILPPLPPPPVGFMLLLVVILILLMVIALVPSGINAVCSCLHLNSGKFTPVQLSLPPYLCLFCEAWPTTTKIDLMLQVGEFSWFFNVFSGFLVGALSLLSFQKKLFPAFNELQEICHPMKSTWAQPDIWYRVVCWSEMDTPDPGSTWEHWSWAASWAGKKVLGWATNQESQCCNHLVEGLNLQHMEEGLCYGTYPLATNFCILLPGFFCSVILVLVDQLQDPTVLLPKWCFVVQINVFMVSGHCDAYTFRERLQRVS